MANARSSDRHTMAVNHIGDAVRELPVLILSQIRAQSDAFRIGCRIFREVVGLH